MARKKGSRARGPSAPRLPDTLRLSADGHAMVLGGLEAKLLRVIWDLGRPATAREVHESLVDDHPNSPLTSITVLNRLVGKGILRRSRIEGRYRFSAVLDESAFLAHASRRAIEGILSLGPDAVAASLVDVMAERDPTQLQELARLIRRRLRDRDGG